MAFAATPSPPLRGLAAAGVRAARGATRAAAVPPSRSTPTARLGVCPGVGGPQRGRFPRPSRGPDRGVWLAGGRAPSRRRAAMATAAGGGGGGADGATAAAGLGATAGGGTRHASADTSRTYAPHVEAMRAWTESAAPSNAVVFRVNCAIGEGWQRRKEAGER